MKPATSEILKLRRVERRQWAASGKPDPLDRALTEAGETGWVVVATPLDGGDRWLHVPKRDPREVKR